MTGCAGSDEAGLRAVETRLEALQHHAIARGLGTRVVWIVKEFVGGTAGNEAPWRAGDGVRTGRAQPPSVSGRWCLGVSRWLIRIFEVAIGAPAPVAAG